MVPVGEQLSVTLHPLCETVHDVSWQVPLRVQLPDTLGQLPPPPFELPLLHANAHPSAHTLATTRFRNRMVASDRGCRITSGVTRTISAYTSRSAGVH